MIEEVPRTVSALELVLNIRALVDSEHLNWGS